MRSSGRRAQTIWLALMGVVVALISLASVSGGAAISPAVAFGLVVTYLAVLFVTLTSLDVRKIGSRLRQSVTPVATQSRATSAARRADQRARARADYGFGTDESLVDVGLMINERRRDGSWDRHLAESASLDDGFLQPYIKLYAPADRAERMSLITFEFYDRSGQLQFKHEMQEYLRTGDNLILCERQLALRGNEEVRRAGTWDLRVTVDGKLVGIHDFSMSSAGSGRAPERHVEPEVYEDEAEDEDYERPVSLEDLLREQARRANSSRN